MKVKWYLDQKILTLQVVGMNGKRRKKWNSIGQRKIGQSFLNLNQDHITLNILLMGNGFSIRMKLSRQILMVTKIILLWLNDLYIIKSKLHYRHIHIIDQIIHSLSILFVLESVTVLS